MVLSGAGGHNDAEDDLTSALFTWWPVLVNFESPTLL